MRLIIFVAAAAVIAGAAHADPTGERLNKTAEACIRDGAPKVAAQAQGLTDAVSFLIDDLCAQDIRHAEAYARNWGLMSVVQASLPKPKAASAGGDKDAATPAPSMAARSIAQLAAVTIDPDTGDLIVPGTKSPLSAPLMLANWFAGGFANSATHARFRAVAADAVLAVREAAPERK